MLIIKCSRCKAKILKYKKIGKGRVLRCWEGRIRKMYGLLEGGRLICRKCGNVIGEVEGNNRGTYIKMNQSEFTYSGTKTTK